MEEFINAVKKGDFRYLMQSDDLSDLVKSQSDFDALFPLIFHHEKKVALRAADVVEKLTVSKPELLISHQQQILSLLLDHPNPEQKSHLAQLVTRLTITDNLLRMVWSKLKYWATNPNENKFVRVNSLQALYDIMTKSSIPSLGTEFKNIVRGIEQEHIPSISARIKKLRKQSIQNG